MGDAENAGPDQMSGLENASLEIAGLNAWAEKH